MTRISILVSAVLLFTFCSGKPASRGIPGQTLVEITCPYGKVKILLYEDTPIHRDNFIKLIQNGTYEGLLFHRVIKGFMVQGGDPGSKDAPSNVQLGNGDPGYTLPAEILPVHSHKRGALAAARMGDEVNPDQRSSGSQFYIVQGRSFSDAELTQLEARVNQMRQNNLYLRYFIKARDQAKLKTGTADMNAISAAAADSVQIALTKLAPFKFTDEQRNIYKTQGGAPHLDGSYTVFGEVIEGMEVIDQIAAQPVDNNSRPLQNIAMSIKQIK